ncbi:type II toxin-antitoxin system PemK/MazF family toxin [Corynebacterium canis]|uniref:type II toxin-antitoxin system PemK/MazF family toxin n=1 Tax=Corynebacterium canis TaxID=679663 RepID=UPI001FEBEB8C|nr:type II toxin-antitoxin system PemK/MazF family toxin [Corynebacterium canis]
MGRKNSRRFTRLLTLARRTTRRLVGLRILDRMLRKASNKDASLHDRALDRGLAHLGDRLGLDAPPNDEPRRRAIAVVNAKPTHALARSLYYAPDMDGQADPGEVVWIMVNTNGPDKPPMERAIVVVGRAAHNILGLLISPDDAHKEEHNWLDIGAGAWDEASRQCWVRLDKVLEVPELHIRRQGAIIPRQRFERIANRLRKEYGWG